MQSVDNRKKRVAVLGGGPTALSAAYHLLSTEKAPRVDIYEASSHFGGVLKTEKRSGFQYELGPNSMNCKHQEVADLLYNRLSLADQIERRSADVSKAYIVHQGQLKAVPTSPIEFAKTSLLSWKAKLRLLKEPFIPKLSGRDAHIQTVGSFFRRRLGPQVEQNLVDPALGGIYSASPAKLSMKHAFTSLWELEQKRGSVIGGMLLGRKDKGKDSEEKTTTFSRKQLRESISFVGGMQALADVFISRINQMDTRSSFYRFSKVRTLDQDPDGAWRINGRGKYDAVISTIPTFTLDRIDTNSSVVRRGFKQLARKIEYSPVSIVVLGFDKKQVPKSIDGFGALLPSSEGRKMLGVNFSSSSFPNRLEDPNKVFLTVYMGGDRSPKIPFQSNNEIVKVSTKEVQEVLGIVGDPCFSRVKSWKKGIPQFNVGFDRTLCKMAQIEEKARGLVLAGNYRNGVGVPDALLSGIQAADKVLQQLSYKKSS